MCSKVMRKTTDKAIVQRLFACQVCKIEPQYCTKRILGFINFALVVAGLK